MTNDQTEAGKFESTTDQLYEDAKLDIFLLEPAYQKKRKDTTGNNMYKDKLCAMFMRPVTGLEMNSKLHFLLNSIRNLQPQPATATATATCNRNLLSAYKTHTHTRNAERARDNTRVTSPWGTPGGKLLKPCIQCYH